MMRVIIVDDEQASIDLSKLMMKKNKSLDIVATYTNPKEAIKAIKNNPPDVVFLDIEMPYINGIDLGKMVSKINSNIQIVYLTAYKEYAIKAFEVEAVNYILKPMSSEALDATIDRLYRRKTILNTNITKVRKNKIITFGEFSIYNSEGNRIKWPTAKAKELFGYFVINKDREIDKWELCEVLFKDMTSKNAQHNLHSTISRAKAALKAGGIIDIISCSKGKYSIDFSTFSCDLWSFNRFLNENANLTSNNIYNYEDIINLYRGELFKGEDYLWSTSKVEKLSKVYLYNIQKLASYYINNEEYEKAEIYLEEYIKVEPYNEDVVELLIRVYYFRNKFSNMDKLYSKTKKIFHNELGIDLKESVISTYNDLKGSRKN